MIELPRIIALLIVLSASYALGYLIISQESWSGRLNLLGYFTILSNILVLTLMIFYLFNQNISGPIELATGAAIIVTAVVFQLFLKKDLELFGVSLVVADINHGSTALLYILWFLLVPSPSLGYSDLWAVIPFPAGYILFASLEGLKREEPRYFFLDLKNLGMGPFLFWITALAGVFLFLGLLLIFIKMEIALFSTF
ncbi:MAG: Pr6Pr family membrane protein [Spirochaetaceae bacterium]|jgi:hypothetical protein|nr:Pr6Pr family membrane protein [Spirochaetaceae bacterium]